MNSQGVPGGIEDRFHPEEQDEDRIGRIATALGENGAHFVAILGAERRRISVQESPVEPHHALSTANPLSRASLTSCVSRRASARATIVPYGVMR